MESGGVMIQCTDFRGGGHDTVLRMGGGAYITVHSYRGGGGHFTVFPYLPIFTHFLLRFVYIILL